MTETPRAGAAPRWRARVSSIRTELLVNLTMLATAALVLVVATSVIFGAVLDAADAASYLTLLIVADAAVFVLFGAALIRRVILRPLEEIVAAADGIAAGDLSRRVPLGRSAELQRLGTAINWMTERLIAEQDHVARVEKMASVGRLAAGVAHEIGNPLGAINGYTHLLRRHVAGDAAAEEKLAAIERESGRVDRIIRGLLDYARPRRTPTAAMNISEAACSVVTLLSEQGVLRRLRVSLALGAGLPPLAGDRHEMEQALVNLLLNAADAMPEGGDLTVVTRRATLADVLRQESHRADDPDNFAVYREPSARVVTWLKAAGFPPEMLQIVIADSGPGVPDEDRERIFDPFYTTKEPGKGVGLGLAIVARLVDSLGGAIWVRRAREGGAAFVILFPIAPMSASDRAALPAARDRGDRAALARR